MQGRSGIPIWCLVWIILHKIVDWKMRMWYHQAWNSHGVVIYMFKKKAVQKNYDQEQKKPVLKCSICNGEQVAGFKDLHTGKFEEIMLIKNDKDLNEFMKMYGIKEIGKEY